MYDDIDRERIANINVSIYEYILSMSCSIVCTVKKNITN